LNFRLFSLLRSKSFSPPFSLHLDLSVFWCSRAWGVGQNAVVCGGFVCVGASLCWLSGCDWVVGTVVWDIEGGVCVVAVGERWVVLECVRGKGVGCLGSLLLGCANRSCSRGKEVGGFVGVCGWLELGVGCLCLSFVVSVPGVFGFWSSEVVVFSWWIRPCCRGCAR
jgi:hypothetical protein